MVSAKNIVQVDTLSIVPGTFSIEGVDTSAYEIDIINAVLKWKKNIEQDSVTVLYRVFPFRFNELAHRYSYDSVKNNFIAEKSYTNNTASENDNRIFNFGKVDYGGSFGRSISVGNNQDAVFNSQFNLQLSGYLADSIEIAAAITDNNIPIQPDGTTQQLNEFDKVLLQFRKPSWEIDLGDIDLRQNKLYFLNFYKRLQGIAYTQKTTPFKNVLNTTTLSGAIAKGKFARNIFQGEEGNQGPYKLQGNNNELFFIILAGTEKVFLDGELMQRGEDQDYVINYNTAEITFTPKRMINKDTRIQVEFEYADRNFLNSMLYVSNSTAFGNKLTIDVAAYSNTDAKNSPINQTLDNPQKQFLANIGDSIQNAYYPYSSIDTFSTDKILYAKIDTAYNGVHDSVYVYSTNADIAKYNLSFADVGTNKGNYVPVYNAANGQVFQWVQPVNGIPQGNYEPATFLVTPKKQQLLSVGATYQLDNKTMIRTELAASKYDVNTFSLKNDADNQGFAAKFLVQRTDSIPRKNKAGLQLLSKAGYEWVDRKFRPIERLRPVEFTRDWGLPLLTNYADEKLPSLSFALQDDKGNTAGYAFTSYIRSDGFKGYRNEITQLQNIKGWQLNNQFSITNSNTPTDQGYYLRPVVDLSKVFKQVKNYTIGATYALEYNKIHNRLTDTITPLSFGFETVSAYIRSDMGKKNHWSFTYYTRKDELPYQKQLLQYDRSHNYNFQAELLQNQNQQLRFNVTYRQLIITNSILTTIKPDNSLLGRVEYIVNAWHGFIRGNALYELGNGQEPKRTFTYIEVPAGQGQYTWVDYNNDGIQQLNEFNLAIYTDQAKFVRIYTPTSEYIKANYTQLNYALNVMPQVIAKNIKSKSLKKFVSAFMWQSSLQTFKKQLSQQGNSYSPFKGNITDTALLNLNYIVSNTISFNRFSTVWGADISNLLNYNKSLLTYGTETNQFKEWQLKARVNIAKQFTVEVIEKYGNNNLFTPAFKNRNYAIDVWHTEPRITYSVSTKYRLQLGYEHTTKNNAPLYGNESAIINALTAETKYSTFSNTSLTAKVSANNIKFTGETNTTVSYIMLDALLPGRNFLWSLELTKRFINNLELNIEYEGRKSPGTKTIQTGRVSLSVLL